MPRAEVEERAEAGARGRGDEEVLAEDERLALERADEVRGGGVFQRVPDADGLGGEGRGLGEGRLQLCEAGDVEQVRDCARGATGGKNGVLGINVLGGRKGETYAYVPVDEQV